MVKITPFSAVVLLTACSAAGSVEYETVVLEDDTQQPPPPLADTPAEQFELGPVPDQYHGGSMVEGYGLQGVLQDGGDTTWAFREAPTQVQLDAAVWVFEELERLAPNWVFVQQDAPDERTDIVIRFGYKEASAACVEGGTCWLGSANCATMARGVHTGLDGTRVCESWYVEAGVNNMAAFLARTGAPAETAWRAFFLHEVGHTLGFKHAPKNSKTIMNASLFIPSSPDIPVKSFRPCEIAKLNGYLPFPGAWYPLEAHSAEECQ